MTEIVVFLNLNTPKSVPKGPVNNKSAMVQIMASCRTSNDGLAYLRIYASLRLDKGKLAT